VNEYLLTLMDEEELLLTLIDEEAISDVEIKSENRANKW